MTTNSSLPARTAEVTRNTAETQITARVNLDGTGVSRLATGIGFFDHMLDQIARHGLIDLDIQAAGDLHIDGHHTVEDVGITLGQAVALAVGGRFHGAATTGKTGRVLPLPTTGWSGCRRCWLRRAWAAGVPARN